MSSASPLGASGASERHVRLQQVLDRCIDARVSGASLRDEQIMAEHPDLMPELDLELRRLAVIERARQLASGSSAAPHGQAALAHATQPGLRTLPGYELLEEIHRGGQGVVYKAVQLSTQRIVAIKLLRAGYWSGRPEADRFQREVHILAGLQHPNIVAVHDSGVAPDGSLYFVMDFVDGVPLDQCIADCGLRIADWKDSPAKSGIRNSQFAIRNVLRLFAKVCDAVNAAHLRGVIHRDLKPSNILIDAQDEPRVLDFGLAKLVAGESEPPTPVGGDVRSSTACASHPALAGGVLSRNPTITGQFVGSLPWASPEQAEGAPEKIDVRTDVYSLGVILYRLLTGQFPYNVTGTIRDVLDRVARAAPSRPSTHVRAIDDEIDTLVMRCLSKDRERRYQSAGELARDIRHYLAGEPIEAKRDSPWYVLRKTLRRYRAAVAVAAAFVLLVTGSTVALSLAYGNQRRERTRAERALQVADQARQAEQEQRAAAQSRAAEARAEAAKAVAVKQFLQSMLSAADPKQAGGRDVTVREVLDQAARQIDNGSLSEQSAVEADVRRTIAATYASLHLYASAIPHYQWLLDYRTRTLGREHLDTLQTLQDLAGCYSGMGRTSDALPAYDEALKIAERVYGPDHQSVLHACLGIGGVLVRSRRSEEAEPYFTRALNGARWQFGAGHAITASALFGLGCVYRDAGRSKEAEETYRAALTIEEQRHGPASVSAIRLRWSLASHVLQVQRRFDEAESLLRETLNLARQALGPDHPQTIVVQANLGDLLRIRGHLAEAETLLRDAFTRSREIQGVEDTEILNAAVFLAKLLRARGEREAAAEILVDEVSRARATQDEQTRVHLLSQGAQYLYESSDSAMAEAWAREALDLRIKIQGPDHLDVAANYDQIGEYGLAQAEYARADEAYRQALAIRQRRLGADDAAVDASLGRVATAQCFLGHAEMAIAQLRDLHSQLTAELGTDARRTQAAFTRLLHAMYYDGRYSERADLLRDEAARQREKYGGHSAPVANILTRLGTYLLLAGDAAGATEALREAMATYEQLGKRRTATYERVKVYLAEACLQLGQQAEAEALGREGLDALRARYDARDLRVGDAQRVLGKVLLRQGDAAQAEPLLRESVAVLSDPQFVPLRAWYWFDAQQAWAECLMAQQRFDEAETLLRELMYAQQKFFGAWPARAAATESLLGACLAHVPRLQDVAPARSPSLDGLPEHQSSMPNLP